MWCSLWLTRVIYPVKYMSHTIYKLHEWCNLWIACVIQSVNYMYNAVCKLYVWWNLWITCMLTVLITRRNQTEIAWEHLCQLNQLKAPALRNKYVDILCMREFECNVAFSNRYWGALIGCAFRKCCKAGGGGGAWRGAGFKHGHYKLEKELTVPFN